MYSKIFRLLGFLALPIAYLLLRPYMISWSEDWEWVTLLAGIFLLGLEVFVIPGFGVAGISAFVIMYAGLVCVMLNNKGLDFSNVTTSELSRALVIAGILLVVVIVALLSLMPSILRSRQMQDFTNTSSLDKKNGYVASHDLPKLVGKVGITETILRPSGKIIVENQLYDATTEGDFIHKGEHITVLGQAGTALRVRKV